MRQVIGFAAIGLALATGVSRAAPAEPVPPPDSFTLDLHQAEREALHVSSRLKSFASDEEAAVEQADAQHASLLPRVTFEASFTYLGEVPSIPLPPPFNTVTLGAHENYSVGPVVRYTLWDTGAARKSYSGLSKLAEARGEDRKNAMIETLASVRQAYGRVQLALEELRLVDDSLALSRAEDRDVAARFRAGAAARLDVVTSQRQVLGFQLQFKQKQADLSSALKDLLALVEERRFKDLSHPGPPHIHDVSLVLRFDSLDRLLAEEGSAAIPEPDDGQPRIRGPELQAESSELAAASEKSQLFPSVQLMAKTSLDYPDGPILERINQNTVGVTLSMPLFEADRSRHQAAEKAKEAESARFLENQTRIDIHRDFQKAREMLESLREQKALALDDIRRSEEEARLYYDNYKAGKINLIDVQSANLQALTAKVSAARIDALILDQLITLIALSGKEVRHD